MNDQYSICIWTILSFKAPPAFDGSTGSQQLSKQCSMFIALKCSSSFTNVYLSGIYPLFNESSLPFSSDIAIWIKNFQTNSLLPRSATHVSDEVQFHFPILVNWLFYIVIFRLFTRRSEFKNLWRRSPNSTDSWFALLRLYHRIQSGPKGPIQNEHWNYQWPTDSLTDPLTDRGRC